jgi:type I restriction enzyme S subunit
MIKNKPIPPGFKPSHLGPIPNDWQYLSLSKYGCSYSGLSGKEKIDFGFGKPYISYLNIFNNSLVNEEQFEYVNIKQGENQTLVKKDDLLFTTSSETPEEVGMCSVYKGSLKELYLNSFCFGFRLFEKDSISAQYMVYLFRSQIGRRIIFKLAQGATRYNLSKTNLLNERFPLPPLTEQTAIANLLSTWDRAIETTQKLIAQKDFRKKWLMQMLLTGKKRVKGFEGKWEKQEAGEIFRSVSKKGFNDEELLSATQDKGIIPRSTLEARVTMPIGETTSFKLVENGDFVISLRSFQGGIEYSKFRGIVSPAYTVLKPKKQLDNEFYKYYFKSFDFIGHLSIAVIGIRDGKQISFNDFSTLTIPYPNYKEQIDIAQIFVSADKETHLFKTSLEKLKEQKKGLMQALLTGKKRLKLI